MCLFVLCIVSVGGISGGGYIEESEFKGLNQFEKVGKWRDTWAEEEASSGWLGGIHTRG